MYWIRGFVLQGLRALNLTATRLRGGDRSGQRDDGPRGGADRRDRHREAGLTALERSEVPGSASAAVDWTRFDPGRSLRPRARLVPFYLPQFHPIEQNDRWWGRGFTEWSNVAAARPVYLGHHQPKLPTDTGFYDLRLEQTLQLQATLARDAGIAGSCTTTTGSPARSCWKDRSDRD